MLSVDLILLPHLSVEFVNTDLSYSDVGDRFHPHTNTKLVLLSLHATKKLLLLGVILKWHKDVVLALKRLPTVFKFGRDKCDNSL